MGDIDICRKDIAAVEIRLKFSGEGFDLTKVVGVTAKIYQAKRPNSEHHHHQPQHHYQHKPLSPPNTNNARGTTPVCI